MNLGKKFEAAVCYSCISTSNAGCASPINTASVSAVTCSGTTPSCYVIILTFM